MQLFISILVDRTEALIVWFVGILIDCGLVSYSISCEP